MNDYRARIASGLGYAGRPPGDEGPTRLGLLAAKDKRIAELEAENIRLREELLYWLRELDEQIADEYAGVSFFEDLVKPIRKRIVELEAELKKAKDITCHHN